MSWFLLGDVPHTRRRGIIMRRKHLRAGNTVLGKAIHASRHYKRYGGLEEVRVSESYKDYIMFEVWQTPYGTPPLDPCYSVFYIRVPVTEELLQEVCESDYGRGMKSRWCRDSYD